MQGSEDSQSGATLDRANLSGALGSNRMRLNRYDRVILLGWFRGASVRRPVDCRALYDANKPGDLEKAEGLGAETAAVLVDTNSDSRSRMLNCVRHTSCSAGSPSRFSARSTSSAPWRSAWRCRRGAWIVAEELGHRAGQGFVVGDHRPRSLAEHLIGTDRQRVFLADVPPGREHQPLLVVGHSRQPVSQPVLRSGECGQRSPMREGSRFDA